MRPTLTDLRSRHRFQRDPKTTSTSVRFVGRTGDLTWRIQIIAVHVIDRDTRSDGLQGCNGNISQPAGRLDQVAGTIIFPQQVPGLIVSI